jgi:hypothetical protein
MAISRRKRSKIRATMADASRELVMPTKAAGVSSIMTNNQLPGWWRGKTGKSLYFVVQNNLTVKTEGVVD